MSKLPCFGYKGDTRLVHFQQPSLNNFPSNKISNTKYTIFNYLILSFIEQFSLRMNQYFLFLAFLQVWSLVSPVNPITTWIPLSVIVGVGMLKETVDDLFRFYRDFEANNTKCSVIRNGIKKKISSKDMQVGDLVYIEENEQVRADIVLLKSSSSEGNAYIETSNIDGETDYKQRKSIFETQNLSLEELKNNKNIIIECSHPNDEIYSFDSTLTLNSKKYSISNSQLLLQGTMLRNTEFVYGVIVYSGNETKIGKNKQELQIKWTRSDVFINRTVAFTFIFQLAMMIFAGTIGNIYRFFIQSENFYLGFHLTSDPWYEIIIIPLRYLLLCSLLIPQSLKITQDISKYVLSWWINFDIKLYDEETDTPAIVQNTGICEDLGNIEYLFSDKTGTLTQNEMIFKKFSIDDVEYSDTDIQTTLVLCHTVSASLNQKNETSYHAPSIDEGAFINATSKFGATLISTSTEKMEIDILGNREEYEILSVLEFTSARKRMSIVVKNLKDGKIYVYTKGADEVMFKTVSLKDFDNLSKAKEMIKNFASEGLRTLSMGYKEISQEEYNDWFSKLQKANKEIHERDEAILETYSELEKDFFISGCSGIEDALQEDVAETIESFRHAGIIVWMLTGDKLETAVQIGHACKLIPDNSNVITVTEDIESSFHLANESNNPITLVIHASILNTIIEEYATEFKHVAKRCQSVICCRMSPLQKGRLVKLMKGNNLLQYNKRTLSVGDGANDIVMLREADVGIGVRGKEGLQAVRSSDISISKFKYLKRLILVHGNRCNIRMSYISQYAIFKCVCAALCQFIFSTLSAFSGQPVLTSFPLTCYNLFFTSLLPITWLFNRDISDVTLEAVPELYKESQTHANLNTKTFVTMFLYGIYQAIIICFVTFFAYDDDFFLYNGTTMDTWKVGMIVCTLCVMIQIIMVGFWIQNYTMFTVTCLIISFCLFAGISFVYTLINPFDPLFLSLQQLFLDPHFYLVFILAVTLCLLPAFFWKSYVHLTASFSSFTSTYIRKLEQNNKTQKIDKDIFYRNIQQKLRESQLEQKNIDLIIDEDSVSTEEKEELPLLTKYSKRKKK
eukprot:gene11466-4630_t